MTARNQNISFAFGDAQYGHLLPPDSKGVCVNLCAEWLQIFYSDKGSATARRAQLLQRVRAASLTQKAYANTGVAMDRSYDFVLHMRQIKKVEQHDWNFLQMNQLYPLVHQGRRKGIIFGFAYLDEPSDNPRDGSGHAIAFWRSGKSGLFPSGHVYVFDPNCGEYKMDKSVFKGWLPRYLEEEYGEHAPVYWVEVVMTEGGGPQLGGFKQAA